MRISIEDLSKAVGEKIEDYNEHIAEVTKEAIDEVMQESLIEVKARSPRSMKNRKHYQDTWKIKTLYESKESKREVVYNTQYSLTHLLEYGHLIVRNGKPTGRTQAQAHIVPVRESAQQKVIERIKSKI